MYNLLIVSDSKREKYYYPCSLAWQFLLQSMQKQFGVYSAQHSSSARGSIIDKIEMKNEKQCLAEGPKLKFLIKQAKISNSDFKRKLFDDVTWACIKGR